MKLWYQNISHKNNIGLLKSHLKVFSLGFLMKAVPMTVTWFWRFIVTSNDCVHPFKADLNSWSVRAKWRNDYTVGFLVHLSRRLKCTIVITRCPSSVRPSVVVNFSHFRLLLWNHSTEFIETWQEARFHILYQFCVFRADRKNKMAALASDWLRHFRLLLWNRWTEFIETCQEARSQRPLPSLCFFGPIGKTGWPPWPLIGWDIFDFSSETAERNSSKLVRKQDLNVFYQVRVFRADRKNKMTALASDWLRHFRLLLWNRWTELIETWQEARSQRPLPSLCFSGPIGKTRWPPWPLIGWDIFDFSSETAKQNSMKLDRKQDLNVLYQVCAFRADWKNKMAALASDWLKHFLLLLWNR